MDELSMEKVSPAEGHFPRTNHTNRTTNTPSPTNIARNDISSPSELSDLSTDLNHSPFSPKNICPSPLTSPLRGTWHPHVYGKSPQTPTPFLISNILGYDDKPEEKVKVESDTAQLSFDTEEDEVEEEIEERIVEEDDEGMVEDEGEMCMDIDKMSSGDSSLELDEPLNLSVAKRPVSPSPPAETNNNRVSNGTVPITTLNRSLKTPSLPTSLSPAAATTAALQRSKSPINALLPNNVIIPKVKHPKVTLPKNSNKSTSKGEPFLILITLLLLLSLRAWLRNSVAVIITCSHMWSD